MPAFPVFPLWHHPHSYPAQVLPPPGEGALWALVSKEHPADSYSCGLSRLRQGPPPGGQNQVTRVQRHPAPGRGKAACSPDTHREAWSSDASSQPKRMGRRLGRSPVREETGRGQMTSLLWVSGACWRAAWSQESEGPLVCTPRQAQIWGLQIPNLDPGGAGSPALKREGTGS